MKGKKIHVMTVIMKQDGKSKFKMYNFGCLKLTALKKINRVKIIIGMYYDSYLSKPIEPGCLISRPLCLPAEQLDFPSHSLDQGNS